MGNVVDVLLYGHCAPDVKIHAMKAAIRRSRRPGFTCVDDNGRKFTHYPLEVNNVMLGGGSDYEYKGYRPKRGWLYNLEGLRRLDAEGRIYWTKNGKPRRIVWQDEYKGKSLNNLWLDINVAGKTERTGYPTQKPRALTGQNNKGQHQ